MKVFRLNFQALLETLTPVNIEIF